MMKIMDFIPQVFYDAIGRIVPGLILLISFVAIFPNLFSDVWQEYKVIFLQAPASVAMGTVIVAYGLAIVVEGIRNDTEKVRRWFDQLQKRPSGHAQRLEIWKEAWRDFCKAHPSREGMKPPRPEDAVAIDVLRLLDPAVGSRIVKLRAEVALCRTLSTGWSAMLFLYPIYITWAIFAKQELFLFTIVLTVALLVVGIRTISSRRVTIDSRHIRALYNHWLLLVNPCSPQESDKAIEYIDLRANQPPVFIIPIKSIEDDNQLQKEGAGSRKLLVTELWDSIEETTTKCHWLPPNEGEMNQVLQTTNIELGVFTHRASEDRHFHKQGTEIYSVLDGEMNIKVNDDVYTLQRGDTIVVRPGTVHKILKNKPFLCKVINANCHGTIDKVLAEE
jgi:quercetin dioxygenase-like cupin family protein